MKKCILTVLVIYIISIWFPPFLTIIFPVNEQKVEGTYIVNSCTTNQCDYYSIHFLPKNKLTMQCMDNNGTVRQTAHTAWKIEHGHKIIVDNNYSNFEFPYFGDIHRNLFFPWVIKIESAINGQCELEQWNFATKIK